MTGTRRTVTTTQLMPARPWTVALVLDARDRNVLSATQLEQLAVLSTFADGLLTTPQTLPDALFSEWTRLSRVNERNTHRFDLWMTGRDAGCLFWKDDAEPVGLEIVQGHWVASPKQGWVKRGLALDLRHLAWELETRDGLTPGAPAEPHPQQTVAIDWKPARVR